MAKVTLSRQEVEKHIKLDERMLEKISMMGIPVESLSEKELEIEVMPSRPDLLSLNGFLRAIKSFISKGQSIKEYKTISSEYSVIIDKSVEDVRPHTVCTVIKNLKLDDEKIKEIISLQEKLNAVPGRNRKKCAIGIYPLEKIKFPIKYLAMKPEEIKFVPLGLAKELNAIQILQKHPMGREYANLLKGLSRFPVFIDANKKILSMPPVINAEETGRVSTETKDIFIECSGSNLGLLQKILNIICVSLSDMGGTIYEVKSGNITTPNLKPEKMKISMENVNKILGLNIKEKDLPNLLGKMGIGYKSPYALIPAWRTDVLHEIDVIEDIAIAYGYENLIPEIPKISTIAEESRESVLKEKISEIIAGMGFLEISSLHLIKTEEAKKARIDKPILLEDSKTEYKALRPNLLIPILRTLSQNTDSEYPQKIFEMGTIFSRDSDSATGISEKPSLAVAMTPGNFTEAKQALDYIVKMLGLNYTLSEEKRDPFIEGRTGKITINNRHIGTLGEIHPETLRNWHLKMPLSIIEIDLESLFNLLN